MSVVWDVKWCPVSMKTTPLVSLDFDEKYSREGRQGNFKTDNIKLIVSAVS